VWYGGLGRELTLQAQNPQKYFLVYGNFGNEDFETYLTPLLAQLNLLASIISAKFDWDRVATE
jgi:hypothetical protein